MRNVTRTFVKARFSISTISQLIVTQFWPNILDPIFWGLSVIKPFFRPKFRSTKTFLLQNFFGQNLFYLNLVDRNSFETKIFLTKFFFDNKSFWSNFFTKHLSTNFFLVKNLSAKKIKSGIDPPSMEYPIPPSFLPFPLILTQVIKLYKLNYITKNESNLINLTIYSNTTLGAPGALEHRLQRRTVCNVLRPTYHVLIFHLQTLSPSKY